MLVPRSHDAKKNLIMRVSYDGSKLGLLYPYPNHSMVNSHGIDGPFIDDFPIKTPIYKGFSMAMLNNQMVILTID